MNKGIKILLIMYAIGIGIAILWNQVPLIKETAHALLDPSAGRLLSWNLNYGMIILVLIIALLTTIVNMYTTDNETLRNIKKEQKLLQEEMKKYRDNPEKLLELQKKQLEFFPRTFDITLRPALFTFIPLILLFRWFSDYFANNTAKVFGIFSWFWAYLIFSIIAITLFRKLFKLP